MNVGGVDRVIGQRPFKSKRPVDLHRLDARMVTAVPSDVGTPPEAVGLWSSHQRLNIAAVACRCRVALEVGYFPVRGQMRTKLHTSITTRSGRHSRDDHDQQEQGCMSIRGCRTHPGAPTSGPTFALVTGTWRQGWIPVAFRRLMATLSSR